MKLKAVHSICSLYLLFMGSLFILSGCGEDDPPPAISACSTNQALCGGGCVDLQSDSQNCGMCGVQCGGSDIHNHPIV